MPLEICGCGGRMCFYQWDKGRKLQDREMSLGSTSQAHFTNSVTGEVLATDFYNDGGVMRCNVPDELLQVATPLDVMVYTTNEHGDYTETHVKFMVKARKMPPNYTYQTATEAVKEHNETILALTGTDHSTAAGAVAEINETISTNLVEKGVDAVASETTEVLAGKIAEIPNPQDTYNEGVAEGVQSVNTDVLSITGTEQPTAVEAVTEVNATLATNLSDKGVEADATETTESLVGKVGDIKDPQASYKEGYDVGLEDGKALGDYVSGAVILSFRDISADDETATRNYPNMTFSRLKSFAEMFKNNKAVETIGDIYIPNTKDAYYAFDGTNIRSVGKITFNGGNCLGMFNDTAFIEEVTLECLGDITRCDEMFDSPSNVGDNTTLKRIRGNLPISKCERVIYMFSSRAALEEIEGELDLSSATMSVGMFRNCRSLKHVRFAVGSIHINLDMSNCGNLDDASRLSIKNGLADLTGQTMQTIQFHSDVFKKFTDEEITEMLLKNWDVR